MAKGDYVKVKSEIGGALHTDEVKVTGAGGTIETDWNTKLGLLIVTVFGRTAKVRVRHSYATSAVRSVEERRRDEE
jgi:hypothetical protein